MKRIRSILFAISLALVLSTVSVSYVCAAGMSGTSEKEQDSVTIISEIKITDLDEPSPGARLDDRARVVSLRDGKPDGIAWEIPVIWVDASGSRITIAPATGKCYPVFVFYVPDGYTLRGIDIQKGINVKLPTFVSHIYGSAGIVSVSDPTTGISYITGLMSDTGSISETTSGTANDNVSENEHPAIWNIRDDLSETQDHETTDTVEEDRKKSEEDSGKGDEERGKGQEDPEKGKEDPEKGETDTQNGEDPGKGGEDPGNTEERPDEQEEEIDVVSVHCSQGAINALGENFLTWLVNTVKNTVEPQAVNLLVNSFPSFATATENDELGKETGLYVYYDTTDPALAFFEADMNGQSLEYRMAVNSRSFSGATYDETTGEYILTDASRALLDNTVTHEIMHAFMYDYTRNGMLGVDSEGNASLDEEFPLWFVEGTASMVENNYQYRADNFKALGYDGTSYTVEKLTNSYSGANDLVNGILSGSTTGTYVGGYLASMYLANLAALYTNCDVVTESIYSSAALRTGLDYILGELHLGGTLDSVIAGISSYQGLEDYQNRFLSGEDNDSLSFTVGLLNYFDSLSSDDYTANGSVLYDFDREYTTPLPDEETEPVVYAIADTQEMVPSTVNNVTSPSGMGAEGEVIEFPDAGQSAAKAEAQPDEDEAIPEKIEVGVSEATEESAISEMIEDAPVEENMTVEFAVEGPEIPEVSATPEDIETQNEFVVDEEVAVAEEPAVTEEAVATYEPEVQEDTEISEE